MRPVTYRIFPKSSGVALHAALLAACDREIAVTKDFQADMVAWNPELNQPILIEVKRRSPLRAMFSLAHELGHLTLSYSDVGQASPGAEEDRAERLAYERLVDTLLADFRRRGGPLFGHPASSLADVSEGSTTGGLRSAEPVWLSWTRGRFGSHLRRPPKRITVNAPPAHDQVIRQGPRLSLM